MPGDPEFIKGYLSEFDGWCGFTKPCQIPKGSNEMKRKYCFKPWGAKISASASAKTDCVVAE